MRRGIDSQIVVEFLENVDERGGRLNSHWYRKTETVCLAGIVIGVLPDDDRLDLVDGAKVKCRKNLRSRRIDHVVFRFFLQKFFFNLFKVRLLELVGEQIQPGFF